MVLLYHSCNYFCVNAHIVHQVSKAVSLLCAKELVTLTGITCIIMLIGIIHIEKKMYFIVHMIIL